ncbi:hypothetical protein MKZ25_10370 [Solibacillus sp. FSL W7-1464]|uniref:hypothetical protein n=1 Tax=Solibacillus sp. FSL W7-1464 TaxID=2921706 RepID=UPI0030F9CBDC
MHLTTVGPKNIEFTKNLGADEVIDYNTPNYWTSIEPVDVVIDGVGVNQNLFSQGRQKGSLS